MEHILLHSHHQLTSKPTNELVRLSQSITKYIRLSCSIFTSSTFWSTFLIKLVKLTKFFNFSSSNWLINLGHRNWSTFFWQSLFLTNFPWSKGLNKVGQIKWPTILGCKDQLRVDSVPTDMMNNKMTPVVFIVVFSSDVSSKLYSFSRISFLLISKHKRKIKVKINTNNF